MKVKYSIPELYRKDWLKTAIHVWISAFQQLTHVEIDGKKVQVRICAEESIKMFQDWLGVTEDQLDTDSVKSTYYRLDRSFRSIKTQEKSKWDRRRTEADELDLIIQKTVKAILDELE